MTGNRCSHRQGKDLDRKDGLPHLYPDSLPFDDDCLHLKIDSCRNASSKQNCMYTASSRYNSENNLQIPTMILKVGRFATELTDRRYVRSVEFVVSKSTQNACLAHSRISNKQNFEQIIVTLRHISLIQLYRQSTV